MGNDRDQLQASFAAVMTLTLITHALKEKVKQATTDDGGRKVSGNVFPLYSGWQ